MIVDHLNTGLQGGAAIAAIRLHESLRAESVASRFWYSHRKQATPPDESYRPLSWHNKQDSSLSRLTQWAVGRTRRAFTKQTLKRALRNRPQGLELFTHPNTGWTTPHPAHQLAGNILQLHWVANFIDYPSFFAGVDDDKPIVWTLHDMNPFTGGCHYTAGCEACKVVCSHCPQLGNSGSQDLANQIFHIKQAALANKNLHIVACSRWLEDQARSSAIFSQAKSFRTIHHGLDVASFAPQDRSQARGELGLADDCIVIGFGADAIGNHRKGLRELLTALSRLHTKKKVIGLVFGGGKTPEVDTESVELRSVGFVSEVDKQARMYSAMDLFIMPSIEEAFGLTGLEAMACGAPVVAFEAGGIVDYVRPHQTGLLAPVGDADQLASQIDWMIENPSQRRVMGTAARQMVVDEFSAEKQAQEYSRLYDGLLASDHDSNTQRAA